jgi:hypothetical protein
MTFSKFDLDFLKSVGIRADDMPLDDERLAQPDGTIRLLEEYGIPVTRENYLDLAFAGNPPEEPLDGEIEVADTDSHDPVLGFLKANNLPLTRENYLSVAYLGNPPKELDAKQKRNSRTLPAASVANQAARRYVAFQFARSAANQRATGT